MFHTRGEGGEMKAHSSLYTFPNHQGPALHQQPEPVYHLLWIQKQ